MWFKKFVKVRKNSWFWTLLSLHKLFNKELRINYVLEIWNGCNKWEQAFRDHCVDPLVFDRWGYTWAKNCLKYQSCHLVMLCLHMTSKPELIWRKPNIVYSLKIVLHGVLFFFCMTSKSEFIWKAVQSGFDRVMSSNIEEYCGSE